MTVVPLDADLAPADSPRPVPSNGDAFLQAVSAAGASFERADASERAFSAGHGSLLSMVIDRAQADIVLSVASATATRAAQAITTIFNMQV